MVGGLGSSEATPTSWRGASFNGVNLAIGGQAIFSSILPNAGTVIDPYFVKGNTYVLFIWAGTNDIVNGRSAAQIHADIENYASGRKAAAAAKGATAYVVISGIAVRENGGAGSATEITRTTYNASLRTDFDGITAYTNIFTPAMGTTYADVFIDVGNDASLGCTDCWQNLTYFDADQVHLQVAGYAIKKNYALNALRQLGFIP
jgi:hypothetical protein